MLQETKSQRIGVLWEKTTIEQKYYKSGKGVEIKEDNGRDHVATTKGIDY